MVRFMKKRLESHIFDLPVNELRRGYRSDIYFWREKRSLEEHNIEPEILMQVFQKIMLFYAVLMNVLLFLKLHREDIPIMKKRISFSTGLLNLKKRQDISFQMTGKSILIY